MDKLNYAHVVLIPKKSESKEVREFRPISVLNASVKIISMVLANRLKDILGDLIDNYQIGFLKSRNTLDLTVTVQKLSNSPNEISSWGFMLKLDFEKAYDTVDWDCILETLCSGGFSST